MHFAKMKMLKRLDRTKRMMVKMSFSRHISFAVCALSTVLIAASISARAQTENFNYTAPIYDESQAPTLDGRIEDDEWTGAVRIDGFGPDHRRVVGYLMTTRENLYLAVKSQMPDKGGILANVQAGTSAMIHDDSIEIWIDPNPGTKNGARFQLMTNSLGQRWSTARLRGDGVGPLKSQTDAKQWRAGFTVKNGMHNDWWHCEMAVNIDSLPGAGNIDDAVWYIDLWRNWKRPWRQMFMTNRSGRWRFTDEPVPVVRLIDDGVRNEGYLDYRIEVFNPNQGPLPVEVAMDLKRDVMPAMSRRFAESVGGGETKSIKLQVQDTNTEAFTLISEVKVRNQPVFKHSTNWKRTGPYSWVTDESGIKPVDFMFAFYPSESLLRVLADVTNLPAEARLEKLVATIRRAEDEKTVKEVVFDDIVDGHQEKLITLPELEDGEYEIVLRGHGPDVPDTPTIKKFMRLHFPWEDQNLGVTDQVFPPFEPMQVAGHKVQTVLREHQANNQGLWNQVTAKNPNSGLTRPILAEPMRYVLRMDGQERQLTTGELALERISDAEVKGQSRIETQGFKAVPKLTWEYDGMMRVDLDLLPSKSEIESLVLEIPLRAEGVSVYHAMGAGVRNTITSRVTGKQDGTIFTSRNIPSGGLPDHFCSYIYVGTPGRGLCWFAANDAGWSRDPEQPNVELVRQGDVVTLKVHLINKPVIIDETQTITFGLLAAPVKPRLDQDDWRFAWQRDKYFEVTTGVNWGTISWASGYYPPKKDFLIWEKLREATQRSLSDDEIAAVLEHYRPYAAPYESVTRFGRKWSERYLEILETNLRRHKGRKLVFYYNRATNTTQPEFLTFFDEWNLRDYRDKFTIDNLNEHKIFPTDSYINFALYWYGKAFDIAGNHGVYWDNMFFRASYNTHTTDAYKRPDGFVVPATEVWGLRELTKRTFQYMSMRGMKPITMPHITSTHILPVYSFTTVTYDWEWHIPDVSTLQDVMSPEYVALVTNGELAGTWPVVLPYPVPDTPEGLRTFAAGGAVNDVYYAKERWRGPYGHALLRPIREMIDTTGVKVYRHWDEVRAVRPSGRHSDWQIPTIAYVQPGKKALIMVVNWTTESQRVDLIFDPEVLGMDNFSVRDWESLSDLSLKGNRVNLRMKPHGVWLLEVLPEE